MQIAGRWFGVRGRRFVRPTLILRATGPRREERSLAELEHKPWAAQDGEPWLAEFELPFAWEDAAEVELSVAPDITVALRRSGAPPAAPGETVASGRRRTTGHPSRAAPTAPPSPRPAGPSRDDPELARIAAQLQSARRAVEEERRQREQLGRALDDERGTTRRLQVELGRAQAELELAQAAQREAVAAAAEAEAARRAQADSARRAQADSARRAQPAAESARRAPGPAEPSERTSSAEEPSRRTATPAEPSRRRTPAAAEPSRRESAVHEPPHRPLNPSLRHRTWWLGRLLALLFLAAVLVAIWIVIHSTHVH